MKYVGLIKEYNNVKEATMLQDALGNVDNTDVMPAIIRYLGDGVLVLAFMGYIQDFETKALIAPHGYDTDGIWVWPSYLPYYLKKYPNFKLDVDFVKHATTNKIDDDLRNKLINDRSKIEKEIKTVLFKEKDSFVPTSMSQRDPNRRLG